MQWKTRTCSFGPFGALLMGHCSHGPLEIRLWARQSKILSTQMKVRVDTVVSRCVSTYIYLVLDVDVCAVVDEKTHDVHVVVYKTVEDGQM